MNEIIFIGKFKNVKEMTAFFKSEFEMCYGIKLDFRRLHFLNNEYGNYPQNVDYDLARKIISFTYAFSNLYIEEYKKEGSDGYWGMQYNLEMSGQGLKIQCAKDFIKQTLESTFETVEQ